MSNEAWLIVALAIVFVAIGGYTALTIGREKALRKRLGEFDRAGH